MPIGRSRSPTHQQGAKAEDAAAVFMQQQGYLLVAQNFNSRCGEIDLIVRGGNQLVFVEVRQRKANSLVSALESITPAKQRKIIKAAQVFLQQHQQFQHHDCRFDVIAYTTSKLTDVQSVTLRQSSSDSLQMEWIQAAFNSF